MARGRKTIPKELKVVKGTFRKHRDNPGQPEPSESLPEPPDMLDDMQREFFLGLRNVLEELGLESATWTDMITACALAKAEVFRSLEVMNTEGRYQVNQISGHLSSHPAAVQFDKANRQYRTILAELGLSPSAVSKVSTTKKKKKANDFEEVANG